jgi:hypothetical protein
MRNLAYLTESTLKGLDFSRAWLRDDCDENMIK